MDYNLLEQSFDQIFNSWSALQFASDQRCAGLQTRQLVNSLKTSFRQYFTDNDDLQPDEVEEDLLECISRDLFVNIEDGTGLEVATQMCTVYRYLMAGNINAVQELLEKLPNYDASLFTVDEGEGEVNLEIAGGSGSGDSGSGSNDEVAMEDEESQPQRQSRYTTDDDGWTTKHKRNKRPE